MHCDVQFGGTGATFDCGNAGECIFACENKKCAENAEIIATNANNFYYFGGGEWDRLYDNGRECAKNANVRLPNRGNATIDKQNGYKGLKNMKIWSGTNTQNINVIARHNASGDDCKGMEVCGMFSDDVSTKLATIYALDLCRNGRICTH